MKLFVLDLETYYDTDYTLSKMTTEAYIRDPRFETIGVGVIEPASGERKWFEHEQFKKAAAHEDWSKIAVLAHHAHFDGLILSHHYGIKPAFWFDTLSMANALHGPGSGKSLGALAERYEVGAKGHEVEDAKNKHRYNFTPAEWARYGQYCLNDCDLTYRVFQKMLPGFPSKELELIDITIRMFTEPHVQLNLPKMQEFLEYERQRKAELLTKTGENKGVFMSNDQFAELLMDMGVEPQKKPTRRKQKDGSYNESETWAFAKTDAFMQGLLESDDTDVRVVAETRIAVKSTGNETRTERFIHCAERGSMPVYLKYAAAHTLRWGGADSMNWQNLQRVNPDDPRSGTIRKSVQAPPGWLFVVSDSAQIEARKTAYLAGEEWLLDAFRNGRDVYSEFATEAYGRPIDRKKRKEDFIPGFVGKACTLGLGFGLGDIKLAETFLRGAMGGPPVRFGLAEYESIGINGHAFLNNPNKVERVQKMLTRLPMKERLLHCMVASEFVKRYRAKNSQIVKLWGHMDALLGWMNDGIERSADLPVPVKVVRHGLQLEGGLTIHYPGLDYDGRGYSYNGGKSGKERVKAYGGSVTENVVQWLARCVVAEQMVAYRTQMRECGVPVHIALMTHDEIVSLVPEKHAEEALALKLEIMKTSPAWAPGLPLSAEGGVGRVYGEIK